MSDFLVKNIAPFDLALTLDCGQAFRWTKTLDGAFEGVAFDRYLKIKQEGETLILFNTSKEDFHETKEFRTYSEDYGRRKYSIIAVHIFD